MSISRSAQVAATSLFAPERDGVWLKANLHTHTDRSDARWSVAECCTFYAAQGYDLLAITDHWLLTDAADHANGMLLLPGTELNGYTEPAVQHHVLGLGLSAVPDREAAATASSTVAAIGAAGGLAVVAHPEWSKQTANHLSVVEGAHLMEVYNATSQIRQGNGVSSAQWDDLLNRGERWFAIACDDTHMLPGYEDRGKAWVQVRAAERSVAAFLAALSAGHFWSTTGPSLDDISLSPGEITVRCSPCTEIRVIVDGVTHPVTSRTGLADARLPLPEDWRWLRVECEDGNGGIAWSNPFFN